MNYDHLYHAGNHADVLKHLVLLAFIQSLSKKPTAWCYLDTHAGCGVYDFSYLKQHIAPEYKQGVALFKTQHQDHPPPLINDYLALIQQVNPSHVLQYYPGSTYLVRQLARANDKIIACELQYESYQALKNTFKGDKQVAVHHLDGYHGLKAFVPPKEKRGLVLIDPPYETDDWRQTIASLTLALSYWQGGHYLLWYPIKNRPHVLGWLRKLRANIKNEIEIIELCPQEETSDILYGSGVVAINPYWTFREQFMPVLAWIWNVLSINKKGYFRMVSIDSMVK